MLRNYIKIALRNLWRNKVHSTINIFGLSIGIASCILIMLFAKDELTFDKFHSKSDRIYRAWVLEDYGGEKIFFNAVTPYILVPTMTETFPEVENAIRYGVFTDLVRNGDKSFSENVNTADPGFFKIFDFKLIRGQTANVLEDQNNVVITASIAKKYFGNEDPIGKPLEIRFSNEYRNFNVTTVVEDPPANSSIRFGIIVSDLNNKLLFGQRTQISWTNVVVESYILLKEGVNVKNFESKIPSMIESVMGTEYVEDQYKIGLQPITDIHLNPDVPVGFAVVSDPKYVYILSVIAVLILVVGCINFMTLSIGRSVARAKEVGVRKVAGARRQQIIQQFMGEAILITLLGLIIGVVLAIVNLPLFNQLSGKTLTLDLNIFNVVSILGLTLLVGVIAGGYPAILLSGFKPISILKGNLNVGRGRQGLRKSMVTFQFVLSIFLIASTLIMQRQLNYLQNKNLGYDKEHMLVIQMNVPRQGGFLERIDNGFELTRQFINELEGESTILATAAASHTMGTGGWAGVSYTDNDNNYWAFTMNFVDADYIKTMGMEIITGRDFSKEIQADQRRSVIVNEAFVEQFGWDTPIGQKLPGNDFGDHEVIGVVKNFNFNSLHGVVPPLLMTIGKTAILMGINDFGVGTSIIPKLLVKTNGLDLQNSIARVKATWNKIIPNEEFDFTFMDQTIAAQYQQEQNLGKIVSIASILAIVIGSLGLLGLAALTMASKVKEISLRKILGASENTILMMLSKDYIYLVFIAVLVASPITYYLLDKWLESFEYRVLIGAEVFLIAGGIALLVALFTISFQTIKASITKPVDSLKYE